MILLAQTNQILCYVFPFISYQNIHYRKWMDKSFNILDGISMDFTLYQTNIANKRTQTNERIESNVEGWLVVIHIYITQSTIGSWVICQDVIQYKQINYYNQLPPTHQDSFCVMLVKHLKPINLKTNQASQQWGAVYSFTRYTLWLRWTCCWVQSG